MAEPASNRGVLIALAYLWVLALIPLWRSHDPEVRWHAKHGLVLAAAEILLLFSYAVLTAIVGVQWVVVGAVLFIVVPLALIGILVMHAIAIVKGINGTRLNVPVVSRLTDRF